MHTRRFWTLYVSAWVPYALSYYVLFRTYATSPLLLTAYNIIPAVLIGVLVVFWCTFLSWRLHDRWWFYPAQLCSAVLYSVFWASGVLFAGSLGNALRTRHFTFGMFSGYGLQWQFFSGLMIYCNIVGAGYVLQAQASLTIEERRRERAEALQTSAQLSALRAQLNPHFLFNSLNSIAALAGPAQPRTLQAISELAAMLRYTLGHTVADDEVSLREELAFTNQYLALEQLRLGTRLNVVRDLEQEALRCLLPPLTVQPLVENAIRHGLAPRADGGTITLRARVQSRTLKLSVEDDGLGAEPASVEAAGGLGLSIVRKRLAVASGCVRPLEFETHPGAGFKVTLTIPQEEHAGNANHSYPATDGLF